ncbi:hypothetical protein SSX86_031531 [Deinandra increscens subsp. villosa]|uniref:Replication factor A C-terminal domain-containing protein n=1 Tax=Deinandra increscens subsp. villosa TaxID=3103831 RepID=A0AAP0GIU4_9ASTR
MSSKRISDIKLDEPTAPLQIRIIKKWKPYMKPTELCYLFVDIHGDGIEAICASHEEDYFDSFIHIQSCYTLTKYVTVPSRTYMAVVPHNTSLRFGKNASFAPLPECGIPAYYYNFANFSVIVSRKVNSSLKIYPTLLSDYIGRVERIRNITSTKSKKEFIKILVQDEHNNVLEVTVWDKSLFKFQTEEAINQVIAVTSTVVTEYNDTLQLETTAASTISINPAIQDINDYITRYIDLKIPTTLGTGEKKVTIAELLEHNSNENMGSRFACKATITSISTYMKWNYALCSECPNKLYPQTDGLTCVNDGVIKNPQFMYCVHATIADISSSANVIFFDDAMKSFVKIDCKDMVIKHGYTNPKIIPHPILSLKGILKVFHINKKRDGTLAINQVSEALTNTTSSSTASPKTSTTPNKLETKRKEYISKGINSSHQKASHQKASHQKRGGKKTKPSG